MKQQAFHFYSQHIAISLHYNPNVEYDYWLYNGKTNVKPETFETKPERFRYRGIVKESPCSACEFWYWQYRDEQKPNVSIRSPRKLKNRVIDRQKNRADFVSNRFSADLDTISNYCHDKGMELHRVFGGNPHPDIFLLYKQGDIEWSTLEAMDVLCVSFINSEASDDPVYWPKIVRFHELNRNFLLRVHYGKDDINALKNQLKQTIKTHSKPLKSN